MNRMTEKTEHDRYVISADSIQATPLGFTGPAVDRLAVFEDIYQDLLEQQQQISASLEALRQAGKKNSVQFRELMGKKLMNTNTLSLFQARGL